MNFFKARIGSWAAMLSGMLAMFLGFKASTAHAQGTGTAVTVVSAIATGGGLNPLAWVLANAQIAISWILYIILWLQVTIASFFIALEAWFLEFALIINTQIVNSPVVHYGYSISLAMANLGFVFAIIIIAIMTILRVQSYSAKNLLVKVIAAAIAVNFGLIIAGTILNFSDSLSLYLIRHSLPDATSDDSIGITGFSNAITGALNPQRAWISGLEVGNEDGSGGALKTLGGSSAKLLGAIMSIFVAVGFLWAIVIIIGGLIIMLLTRYIWLAMLLVLMPFSWLLWIFPATRGQFSKWWSKFIHWTFFAPALLFFLYLAMQTSTALSQWQQQGTKDWGFSQPGKSGSISYFQEVGGVFLAQLVQNQLPAFLIMGIMIGGLVAANSVGAGVASGTMGALKSFGNSYKGWMKGQAKGVGQRVATSGQQTKGGQTTTFLQRVGGGITSSRLAGYIPGAKGIGTTIARVGKPDMKDTEEGAKRLEEKRRGDTREATQKRLLDLGKLSSDTEILGTMNKAIKTPGLIGGLLSPDKFSEEQINKHKEKLRWLMGHAERMGKGDELAQSDPNLAIYQRQKTVGGYDAEGKEKAFGIPLDPEDKHHLGRLKGAAIAKAKEPEKLSSLLFAEVDKATGKLKSDVDQVVSALSVNNSTMRKLFEENTPAMDSLTSALGTLRGAIEENSEGRTIEEMSAQEIQEAAHKANYKLLVGEAARFKRQLALINDTRQLPGYKIETTIPPAPPVAADEASRRRQAGFTSPDLSNNT